MRSLPILKLYPTAFHFRESFCPQVFSSESLIVNLARQGIIYIPIMFIMGAVFQEIGLVWAQPVTDVLSLILAVWLYLRSEKKSIKKADYQIAEAAE